MPGVYNLGPEKTHSICNIHRENYIKYIQTMCAVYRATVYLQMLVLSLDGNAENLKSAIHAEISSLARGDNWFIRSARRYLYGPSKMVCRHSTVVLLQMKLTIK